MAGRDTRTQVYTLVQKHFLLLVLTLLAVVTVLLYLPGLQMRLIGDDFIYLSLMHFTAKLSLVQDNFGLWFSDFMKWSLNDLWEGNPTLRPVREVSFWSDYLMFGLDPLGYHLDSLALHLGTSFLVVLIGWQLTKKKSIGVLAGLFFAILPIHAQAVTWIGARYHVLAGFLFALTFFFYLKSRQRKFYLLALIAYILALFSNEATVSLPLVLTLYTIVYADDLRKLLNWKVALRLLPFWLLPVGYVGLRFLLLGGLSAPPYANFRNLRLAFKLSGFVMSAADPFFPNISTEQTLLVLALVLVLLLLYRSRRTVVFGWLWIPLTLSVFVVLPPEERYFYIPSIGLVLAFAGILIDPLPRVPRWSRVVGAGLVVALVIVYSMALYQLNVNWQNAGNTAARILAQLQKAHPTLPPDSNVVIVNLPQRIRRAYVFQTGIEAAIEMVYDDPSITGAAADRFPTLTDNLDKTFFFEYDGRKLVERADLVQQLQATRTCSPTDHSITWQFNQGAQGWEAWNDIADMQVQQNILTLRVTGSDPILVSPFLRVNPRQLKRVEVTMSTQTSGAAQGALYWQTEAMKDFSPAMLQRFPVIGDGTMHQYNLMLDASDVGSAPITRIRLDPMNMPGEIAIDSIRIVCER